MEDALAPTPDRTGGMRNAGSPTPAIFPPPESLRPTLVGQDFMVSAGHPIVAQVMAEVLARGGTAIDAGVAGGLASNVVQADMCNLGGVAPILLRVAGDPTVWAIDGVGPWGREVTLERFLDRHGGEMPLGSPVGVVPAAFDAWCTALARFGTWRIAEVLAPARDLAARGFPLDRGTATALGLLGRGFAAFETSRAVYWPRGRPPRAGERLVQTDLARTLSRLAGTDAGPRERGIAAARALFHEGAIAAELIDFHRATGGWLTQGDLAAYASPPYAAPRVAYGGWEVFTPSTVGQGPVMLQALGVLERLGPGEAGGADALHRVAEALKAAFVERERHYADPAFAALGVEELLAPGRLDRLAAGIDRARAGDGAAERPAPGRGRADTTYLAAADAAGNLFSAMPSDTIDGAPIAPGLGFFVSPRGVQSRLDPAHPAALAPGRRPRLTPAPAIAARDATGEAIAFGCPGGDVIVQAMTQAFVNLASHGLTPQQAVEAPRLATFSHPGSFHPHPAFPRRLAVEGRVAREVRAALAGMGHDVFDWPDWEFDAGAVSIAGRLDLGGADGPALVGAADPRRSAYAVGR